MLEVPTCSETGMPKYGEAMKMMQTVCKGIRSGEILSASVVKEGGAAACICKAAFGEKRGFTFAQNLDYETLFAAKQGNIIVEIADGDCIGFINGEEGTGKLLGSTNANGVFILNGDVLTVDELIEAWSGKLEKVFPTDSGVKAAMPQEIELYNERSIFICKTRLQSRRYLFRRSPAQTARLIPQEPSKKQAQRQTFLLLTISLLLQSTKQ